MKRIIMSVSIIFAVVLPVIVNARPQYNSGGQSTPEPRLTAEILGGIELRHIGPTITPGRVGDIVINPRNPNVWYVLVSSGGLWKTTNRGTTWQQLFKDGPYSLGCITLDPQNPEVIWLGTGENQSQRSVGFGDGVYKSTDGGQSWKCMGLEKSEHIGKIIVDPRNSDVVYIASQGPLWAPGGDRGLFKTTDGGETWQPVLRISADTGITDIVMDPRDSDVIYAAAYQRRRNVGVLVGGGQEAGIFKTTDGGESWKMLTNGIPAVDLGRIALGVSPQNPDVVYALIIAANKESGFFRSADCGETFVRQGNYRVVDPQYYGEIFPDPHKFDRVYAMDVRMHVTDDGGKSFERMPWRVHVDQHALAFDTTNADYLLVGNDGGLYETFDGGETWRHFTNMPTFQIYRISVDNALPFYNVYGGSQDNGTQGGPSRTMNRVGIRTSEWNSIGGGDGMQSRVDPEDANVVYYMSQNGAISRLDLRTSSSVSIRPRPDSNGPSVRWNWDTPFIISPHNGKRLYFGGSTLFRSDDRGDNWVPISGDLTRQIDRDTLPVMGRIWGPEAVAKNLFTTAFGVGSALSESQIKEGLIYYGTDEGLIQVTEDGGKNWFKIDSFPTVPDMTYVSDLFASQHDVNTVYAAFNNHQRGDFKPYLLKSTDKGRSWESIASNLPDRHFLWCIVEDPVNKNLLFAGTEFGLFATFNGGKSWVQLKSGAATAPFRDLEIQARENDLVCGTFAYGFYILDDITPLRYLTKEMLSKEGALLPLRNAYYYNERTYVRAAWGNKTYPNPPFGAVFTYYLGEDTADGESGNESKVVLTITDSQGKEIRRIDGAGTKGFHRVAWDLRATVSDSERRNRRRFQQEDEEEAEFASEEEEEHEVAWPLQQSNDRRELQQSQRNRQQFRRRRMQRGPKVKPGKFTVVLNKMVDGELTPLGEPEVFEVVLLPGQSSGNNTRN